MNFDTLSKAILEAERFLATAKELRKDKLKHMADPWITGDRLSGATRRASMDLTRALADLRRPG